jgi:RNA polymerase sigma-70 factor (ECF subfamily)
MASSEPAGEWPLPAVVAASPQREPVVASDHDRERFEAEVIGQLNALLHFALRLTRHRPDAEDLVSDTVLRALNRWRQYQLGTNVRAWLFTILFRLFMSGRRRAGARTVELVDDAHYWSPGLPVSHADPERSFYDSQLDGEIARALDDLPDHYRIAVVLSDLQDLPYADIAGMLGIAEGTVKSRIFRARRMLQLRLARYAAEMGYCRTPAAA